MACREVRAAVNPVWPKEFEADHLGIPDPAVQGLAGRFSDFEPDRLACLALDHRGAFLDMPSSENIPDPQRNEIASTQFAVDCHIE